MNKRILLLLTILSIGIIGAYAFGPYETSERMGQNGLGVPMNSQEHFELAKERYEQNKDQIEQRRALADQLHLAIEQGDYDSWVSLKEQMQELKPQKMQGQMNKGSKGHKRFDGQGQRSQDCPYAN